jgi:hypothetical protein
MRLEHGIDDYALGAELDQVVRLPNGWSCQVRKAFNAFSTACRQ